MFEQLREEEEKELKDEEAKFATWALTQVPSGDFRENYYRLLKEYNQRRN
jgi:hypothetical protein